MNTVGSVLSKNFLQIDMSNNVMIEIPEQRIGLNNSEKELHMASAHETMLNIEYSTQGNPI